ncbi:hypothetical protein HPB47_008888 [Ixodes persulcatus]|uniref:Uncharacterized protein n=1 Tax=Ixodes persulcatus TaxID=34615 RepID=A0AC60P3S4_IXOPE|nr:hypothetical protein HPB47_008888 [Ixodes persulcatus]
MSGKAKFTIDDAFEDEGDDAVRSYGSTTESSALKGGTREECLVVRVEDDRTRRLRLPEDTLSKDSDSLIQCDGRKYDARDGCWWKHPKVRDNWRVMLAALGLLVVGLGLLVTGIVVQVLPQIGVQGLVFFIAGAICLIPGAYHLVYAYCAVKGKRGYDFYNLPLFH